MHSYFVRSGYINIDYEYLYYIGQSGYDWSLSAGYYTSATDARAYYFGFGVADAVPSDNFHRWLGFPLRCLAD